MRRAHSPTDAARSQGHQRADDGEGPRRSSYIPPPRRASGSPRIDRKRRRRSKRRRARAYRAYRAERRWVVWTKRIGLTLLLTAGPPFLFYALFIFR
jgi:hypothetical protein